MMNGFRVGWLNGPLWEECCKSKICARGTYSEPYITVYTTYTKVKSTGNLPLTHQGLED